MIAYVLDGRFHVERCGAAYWLRCRQDRAQHDLAAAESGLSFIRFGPNIAWCEVGGAPYVQIRHEHDHRAGEAIMLAEWVLHGFHIEKQPTTEKFVEVASTILAIAHIAESANKAYVAAVTTCLQDPNLWSIVAERRYRQAVLRMTSGSRPPLLASGRLFSRDFQRAELAGAVIAEHSGTCP